ncbi:hypothetical protein RM549_07765 [Salegentibacter sp. F188]|uniref:DUF6973 domain-containing protein n=1 Tax=Autumnicola patrickiae TaxID=3075591 RepID=A0ABU3E107_9FLAO|nr:hypothetical protein [Salegentibacter sp. F188]MDT0689678.1 hypothetical protein [Salegentibacter sp. F188]
MAILARLRKMDFRETWLLAKMSVSRPRFAFATYKATKETLKICNELFGERHHKNGKANAARHALWNYIICEKCYKISGSSEKSAIWSKKVTDLHEKLAPNDKLAREMDLHNNEIGRKLFKKSEGSKMPIIDLLKEMMQEAIQIEKTEELRDAANNLVFIENSSKK